MKSIVALKVAGIIFLVVSWMHLARVFLKIPVVVGCFHIPLWTSIFGFAIALLLAWWMFKAARIR